MKRIYLITFIGFAYPIIKYFLVIAFFVFSLTSCRHAGKSEYFRDVKPVNIGKVDIQRFDKVLFSLDPELLARIIDSLKVKYPVFLAADFSDSLVLGNLKEFISDRFNREVYNDCQKAFPDLLEIETQLAEAFGYYKAHFPDASIPSLYSFFSGIDFQYPVQLIDTVMIISLDNYLGKDYKYYGSLGIPMYKIEKMQKKYLVRDCARTLAYLHTNPKNSMNTLTDRMIMEGKILFFLDAIMPGVSDSIKIGYSSAQMEWIEKNQQELWAFLVENQLFYSMDPDVLNKFIMDGPYTSFFSKESPARLGHWLGWQIVRQYMKTNSDISLKDMLNDYNHTGIFTRSKYKPGRK